MMTSLPFHCRQSVCEHSHCILGNLLSCNDVVAVAVGRKIKRKLSLLPVVSALTKNIMSLSRVISVDRSLRFTYTL